MRALLLGLAVALAGPAPAAERLSEVGAALQRQGPFMGVLRVQQGDRLLLEQTLGESDLEAGLPTQAGSRYRIGSVSKQFTAAALLRLQDQGKLSLSDPVGKLWPEAPAAWRGITLAQLLTHQSGLPNFTQLPVYAQLKRNADSPAVLNAMAALPLDFAPGSQVAYSNTGYVLAGWLVERVSGQALSDFLRQQFFLPLEMKDTELEQPEALLPRRARGYRVEREAGGALKWRLPEPLDMRVPGGAGALVSTTADLLRWQQALHGGRVLSNAALAQMRTPPPGNTPAMGLLAHRTSQGDWQWSHGGSIEGFSSWLLWRQRDQLGIAVLSNVEGAPTQAAGLRLLRAVDGGWNFGAQPVYLRGSFNAWGTADALQSSGSGRWTLERALPAGTHEFKLGSADWVAVDLGAGAANQSSGRLAEQGGNLQLRLNQPARVRFALSLDPEGEPELKVDLLP